MILFKRFCLAACLCLLISCGEDSPRLSPLNTDARILAFGDSLTHGTGTRDPQTQSYPARLNHLIPQEVIRSGVPGEVSQTGLQRLEKDLARYQPALVLLCHGGNDLLRRLDKSALQTNLETMITRIRDSGAEVVLITVPKPGLFLKDDPIYGAVAESQQVPLVRDLLSEILADHALKADSVHPNSEGYEKMAGAIAEKLRSLGAIQ